LDYKAAFSDLKQKFSGVESSLSALQKENARLAKQAEAAKSARITNELLALEAEPMTVSLLADHVSRDIDWTDDGSDLEVIEIVEGVRRPARSSLKDFLGSLPKSYPNLFKPRAKQGTGSKTRQDAPRSQPQSAQRPLSAAEKAEAWRRNRGQ
jgi:hypothetical protein